MVDRVKKKSRFVEEGKDVDEVQLEKFKAKKEKAQQQKAATAIQQQKTYSNLRKEIQAAKAQEMLKDKLKEEKEQPPGFIQRKTQEAADRNWERVRQDNEQAPGGTVSQQLLKLARECFNLGKAINYSLGDKIIEALKPVKATTKTLFSRPSDEINFNHNPTIDKEGRLKLNLKYNKKALDDIQQNPKAREGLKNDIAAFDAAAHGEFANWINDKNRPNFDGDEIRAVKNAEGGYTVMNGDQKMEPEDFQEFMDDPENIKSVTKHFRSEFEPKHGIKVTKKDQEEGQVEDEKQQYRP